MPYLGAESGRPVPVELLNRRWTHRLVEEGDCWVWTGARTAPNGYGRIYLGSDGYLAHRVIYEQLMGRIPEGMTLDHLCRNRLCVRPTHLEVVTQKENTYRGRSFAAVNAAKTHCPKGHPYDESNTQINATSGSRVCLACRRAYDAARYRARTAA